jgi:hypothetical protein
MSDPAWLVRDELGRLQDEIETLRDRLEGAAKPHAETDSARAADALARIADLLSRTAEPTEQKPADPAPLPNPEAAPKSTKPPVTFTKWLTAKFNAHAKAARATRSKTPPLSAAKLFAEAVDAAKWGLMVRGPKNTKVVSSMLRQLRRRLKR